MREDEVVAIGCGSMLLGFIIFAFCAVFVFPRYECSQLSKGAGVETNYRFMAGCFVRTKEGFIPEENWRFIDRKKIELKEGGEDVRED